LALALGREAVVVPAQRFDQVLPPAAVARLSEINASGTWASALSTEEFTAIKSVGFEPVGQVLGAAVYNIGFATSGQCPTYGDREFGQRRSNQAVFTVVSSSGALAAFAPLVNTLYEARRRAIGRMSAECAALGGHGVVGVALEIGPFSGSAVEFKAIGTAVRAPGGVRLKAPFTSDVSGQEFAKLIMAGAVPVSLVLGISIGVRHDDWLTQGQTRWAVGNVEVRGYTELVNRTRADARNELMLDVSRVHAEGVVVKRTDLRTGEQHCEAMGGSHDHRAEVTMIGTAITQFSRDRRASQGPSLAVLSLDPERRRAARQAHSRRDHPQSIQVLEPDRHDNEQDAFHGSEEQQ
jgi:uncharacterized protein YbjQ (UPF0145 family)